MKPLSSLLPLLCALVLAFPCSGSLPVIEQWGIHEVVLHGPSDGNPFTEVELWADFTDGFKQVEVRGFYDGDGVYRIRFMPDRPGHWTYVTQSNVWKLTNRQGAFEVAQPGPGNHGPVRVFNTYHFAHADGTPYRPFGTTAYSWINRPESLQELTLQTLATSPFNKVRMLIFPEALGERSAPELFPYEGSPPADWDYRRFNPAFFRMLEKRVGDLRDRGIEADIILFHKYGPEWRFDVMSAEEDDHYLRYVLARLSAFRNVWWSLANEYDFIRTKTEADWDRLFQIIEREDPYGRLRSIHNGFQIYDHNKPWITHASLQNGAAVEESGRAQIYRDVWRKPVIFDEVKYEGDISRRWGQLSPQEMVHRMWSGTVAGTYVGHGECYRSPDQIVWISTGGLLRGQSPERIAFLRGIMEDGPHGLDPIDKWQDTRTAGRAGDYYLTYFGRETPSRWPFQLYRDGVEEGQRFRIELIDTWNMTITPVEGEFVATRKDSYHFVDAGGRTVDLPDKPCMALRIRRVDGASGRLWQKEDEE